MADLKRIKSDGIDAALDKADHYRLLNEPTHAESICLDVLEVDPRNQHALVTLLLAYTDQFPSRLYEAHTHAESLIPRLASEYDQHYYEGIVNERWAIAHIDRDTAGHSVSEWLRKAMRCYEVAEEHSNGENPDPILRWNACARISNRISLDEPEVPSMTRDIHSEFGDDVLPR